MRDQPTLPFWRRENPIAWGIGLTIVLAGIVVILAISSGPKEIARYQEFSGLPSNEIGDTLAGIFAPLAFIWIVVTVFLQSLELAEQRKELALTRIELQLAREAQEAQLKVMQKQADIFEDERKHRESESAKRVLDQLLSAIALTVEEEKSLRRNFNLAPRHELDLSAPNPLAQAKGTSDEELVRSISDSLYAFRFRVMDAFGAVKKDAVITKSKSHFFYRNLKGNLDHILSLRNRLSEDQEVRLQSLAVENSAEVLEQLLNADIWDHGEDRL